MTDPTFKTPLEKELYEALVMLMRPQNITDTSQRYDAFKIGADLLDRIENQ